jgi:hypothetical protein
MAREPCLRGFTLFTRVILTCSARFCFANRRSEVLAELTNQELTCEGHSTAPVFRGSLRGALQRADWVGIGAGFAGEAGASRSQKAS